MAARKILITGGSGFLGSYVMERFEREWGVEAYAYSSSECDLTDRDMVLGMVVSTHPDSIIHLAAVCGGIGINREQPGRFIHDNTMMALNVVEAARLGGVKKVVMVGSVCQYPENTPSPFKEEDLWNGYPEPTNAPYGIAKRLGMETMKAYHQQYGMQGSFLIPANLYGPRDSFDPRKSHVIPAIIRKIDEAMQGCPSSDRPVTLWGNGLATRDFLHARDAADAIVRAESLDGFNVMNLGTGVAKSIYELANNIASIMGYKGWLSFDSSMPDGQMVRCIDGTRAKNIMGWEATTKLEDGLAETIAWYRSIMLANANNAYANNHELRQSTRSDPVCEGGDESR